jgi:hypothetical protein
MLLLRATKAASRRRSRSISARISDSSSASDMGAPLSGKTRSAPDCRQLVNESPKPAKSLAMAPRCAKS